MFLSVSTRQDFGQQFSLYGPPVWKITVIYLEKVKEIENNINYFVFLPINLKSDCNSIVDFCISFLL